MTTDRTQIPESGLPHSDILQTLDDYKVGDADYRGGRTWSLVYWAGEEHHHLIEEAHRRFLAENALNPMAFKSLKRMEREVIEMTASMLNAPPEAVGTMTSGGTESLLLAVKTYRDRARSKRLLPRLGRPNMVVPETIHVAFDKAGHLFGVEKRVARTDAFGAVDVDHMARLVDRNTIMLAGSAPQYVHGTVDPIPAIGELALRTGLPLHVDACFGGFMLPWLERLGVDLPVWDFRVPGVSSISADVHKYGFGAKGASTIVYRDMSYLRHQFFVAAQWQGGIYISPGLPGTRPGGPIAAAWTAMKALGQEGYLMLARGALEAAVELRAGIATIPGLRVMGHPHSTIVTWTSTDPAVDVYAVADQLQALGWGVDRQQRPASVHLTVNASNLPVVDRYLADLREAVAHVRAHPELRTQGEAAVYGLMAKVPMGAGLGRFVEREVLNVVEGMYAAGASEAGPKPSPVLDKYGAQVRDVLDKVEGWRDAAKAQLSGLAERSGLAGLTGLADDLEKRARKIQRKLPRLGAALEGPKAALTRRFSFKRKV
ncbi:MAG: aspartate aminotransferase family protein [Deltaproteobacteria bacterium]|nr:aspartate aminotransferase family protein [Deltaproteobacteria bacterium]